MDLELWLHQPSGARYIVLVVAGIVQQAAGPLTPAQMGAAQANEWAIPWMPGLGAWVEARRGEFVGLHPRGAGPGNA